MNRTRTAPHKDKNVALGGGEIVDVGAATCSPFCALSADSFKLDLMEFDFEPDDFQMKIGCQETEGQLSAWADDMLKTDSPDIFVPSSLKSLLPDATASEKPHVRNDTAKSAASHSNGPSASSISRSPFLLSTPQDKQYLSETLCFLRSQIEVFEATTSDVDARLKKGGLSNKRQIALGRVGLRCIHCAHRHPGIRPKGATTYPAATRLLYQAVRNFHRYHFASCPNMPPKLKSKLQAAKKRRRYSNHHSLGYWEESARCLGLIDMVDDGGIRLQKK